MSVFETLNSVNVNDHTESREGLTYLSWAWAWAEVMKKYPDASYEIWKDEQNRPYIYDDNLGYMVFTSVTIEGNTKEMWLPVMDSKNKAMKCDEYYYTIKNPNFKYAKYNDEAKCYVDKYGNRQDEWVKKKVEAATMFDVNKAIMRCLVKNLAMFGLGLYIYAGEDLPETETKEEPKPEPTKAKRGQKSAMMKDVDASVKGTENRDAVIEEATAKAKVLAYVGRHEMSKESIDKICKLYKVEKLTDMTMQMCQHYIAALEKKGGSIDD